MYAYADRIRAVELYIKRGKRIKTTIRQLGYPTKTVLKAWCREYEQSHDLRVSCAARAPKFSEAEKQAAVEHYRTHDRCIASTMRALGYPGFATLTAWIGKAFPESKVRLAGRSWRPEYPEDLKQADVIELCNREESAQAVADRLGVCRPTLYNWRNQLLGHEATSAMKQRKTSPPALEREALERQLEDLQRDIRQLRLEAAP